MTFRDILKRFGQKYRTPGSPFLVAEEIDYVMACFAQIAYLPSEYDIADGRFTKLVPSKLFRQLAGRNAQGRIGGIIFDAMESGEFQITTIQTANSNTILVRVDDSIIIAIRGTVLFHRYYQPYQSAFPGLSQDVLIDLNAIPKASGWGPSEHRYHMGFLDEAARILPLIQAAHRDLGGKPAYLTGHSLGGALTAIVHRLWELEGHSPVKKATVFGCPRFGNRAACEKLKLRSLKMPFDPVTNVPPIEFGYADVDHVPLRDKPKHRFWLLGNHKMENYRKQTAIAAGMKEIDKSFYPRLLKAVVKQTDQ